MKFLVNPLPLYFLGEIARYIEAFSWLQLDPMPMSRHVLALLENKQK